jgi:PD-(D/E)XK endonuclease
MVHCAYTADEVDAIAAYSAELRRGFYVPIDVLGTRSNLQLRLAPSLNNQHLRINWADDFALEARLNDLLGP